MICARRWIFHDAAIARYPVQYRTADRICWKRFFPVSLSNCLRTFVVGAGFACSAGWDWFPALQNEELWSLLENRQVSLNTGLFGDIASIGWFTILMLVFLGLAIDNLFLSYSSFCMGKPENSMYWDGDLR